VELLGAAGEQPPAPPEPGENAGGDYTKAKALLMEEDDGKNWTQAVDLLRRAAEAGHPAAQYQWGMFLIDAFCVEQDVEKGGEFLRKAAEAGNGKAMVELGVMEKDPAKLAATFKKAAEAGDATAMVYQAYSPGAQPGDTGNGSRALLDKAFATDDPEAQATAARMLENWARNEKALEWFGMTREEMDAMAMEGLQTGRREKVLVAYPLLARRLREGIGTEKNEPESEVVMAEFKKLADQKIARGSIAAQFALMEGLSTSQAADAHDETLRMATEILTRSAYPWHHMIAALSGAGVVERKESDKAEGVRKALAWLKEHQARIGGNTLEGFISSYEMKLAKIPAYPPGE